LKTLVAILTILTMTGIARAGGAEIFASRCAICHQPHGQGIPGMYPPLADSIGAYVKVPQGRAYFVHVVSFGMTGPIAVHGQSYNGLMQPWPSLSDDEIAQVLNFVMATFNAKLLPKHFPPFTADEVKKDRASNLGMPYVYEERESLMRSLAK
jgi:mono/diheme cytochrome c family protein